MAWTFRWSFTLLTNDEGKENEMGGGGDSMETETVSTLSVYSNEKESVE